MEFTFSPNRWLLSDEPEDTQKSIALGLHIPGRFDKILDIGSIEKEDLNLLRLKKAIFISENSKEENMLELLNPIINSDSVWKIQSIKFLGDYYFSLKQFNKAKQYYLILISDNDIGLDKNEIKRKLNIIGDE